MKSGQKIVVVILLFLALVLVNYLAAHLPLRGDATAEKIYTLSPGTRSLLSKIEEPVALDFYFTQNVANLPVSYKNYAARVEEMLRQYQRTAGGKLVLNVIDPQPDTPEEEKARAAGLQPQAAAGIETPFYFGLVALQADQQKNIPVLSPQREQFLEYDLSELISSVQQIDKKKLGLITGLPLQAPPYNPMMAQRGQRPPQSQFVIGEWEKHYEIVPVEEAATELPTNLDALAVIHPPTLSPKLQYAIDQFLLAGKPVFVAVDPASQHFRRQASQAGMYGGAPEISSDLPTLFKGWGINYTAANVVGDLDHAAQVQTRTGQPSRLATWLLLDREAMNAQTAPTSQLKTVLFVEPGSVSLAEGSILEFTPLFQSSTQSGDLDAQAIMFDQPEALTKRLVPSGTKTLAALVTGTFKSAFPEGAPKDPPAEADTPPPPPANPSTTPPLKEGTSTLIVVADSDWLLDDFSVRRFNFLGMQGAEPINDNLAFGSNALDFLAGSQDLISIRGKGQSLRPFTVVRDMEIAAQKKYQDQLDALESRLQEIQTKLSELQGKTANANRLVATPEVQKAIDDFQKQEATMRRERRDIRRALREDVDALETRLLWINLLATPALVGLFGLWFQHRRR